MSRVEKVRRNILILMLLFVAFITTASTILLVNSMSSLSVIDRVGQNYFEKNEEFLDIAKRVNYGFLKTVSDSWDEYILDGEVNLNLFISSNIRPLRSSAYRSIIILKFGDVSTVYYNISEYHRFDVDDYDLYTGEFLVFDGELDDCFGCVERFFVEGVTLEGGGISFDIYVGFYEQVMHKSFISTLDIRDLATLEDSINLNRRVALYLSIFSLSISLFIAYYGNMILVYLKCSFTEDVARYRDIIHEIERRSKSDKGMD